MNKQIKPRSLKTLGMKAPEPEIDWFQRELDTMFHDARYVPQRPPAIRWKYCGLV